MRISIAVPAFILALTANFALSALLFPGFAHAEDPYDFIWMRLDGSGNEDGGWDIATDANGNSFSVGCTDYNYDDNNSGDAYIVAHDSDGNLLWQNSTGSAYVDVATCVATDGSGNVYIAGYTWGGIGGYTSAGGVDTILIKYDGNGNKLWVRQFGTTEDDGAYGITNDPAGNVYVTGCTYGGLNGNAGLGGCDIFVVKYNTNGNMLWTKQLGTSAGDGAYGIASDGMGYMYVVGSSGGDFGGNTNAGNGDLLVIKLDSGGNVVWSRLKGTAAHDGGRRVTICPDGGVCAIGNTYGAFAGFSNAGSLDIFATKLASDGNVLWLDQTGTSQYDQARDIAADGYGKIYVAFQYGNVFPGAKSAIITYTQDGDIDNIWEISCFTPYTVQGMAVDDHGYIYLAGSSGSFTLGCGDQASYKSHGSGDILTFKFAALPVVSAITSPADDVVLPPTSTTISGTAEDRTGYGLNGVEVSTDGGTSWDSGYDLSGIGDWTTWGYDWVLPADGGHELKSRAYGSGGDVEPLRDGVRVSVDGVAPSSTITDPFEDMLLPYGLMSYSIKGTASDDLSGVSLVEVSVNDGPWQAATGTTSWSYYLSTPDEAVYNVRSRATDVVGNVESAGPGVDIIKDYTAPESAITSPSDGQFVNGPACTIAGTASDNAGGVNRVQVSVNGGSTWHTATDTSGDGSWSTWSYAWTANEGSYDLISRATDNAGNRESSFSQTMVSVAGRGVTDESLGGSAVSEDGRYIAYESVRETRPCSQGTCNRSEILVYDRLTGETREASASTEGVTGNGYSIRPSISADGRYVAYMSTSDNLVPGDTNDMYDIFVRDMQTGETTRVSVASDGGQATINPGGLSPSMPFISADGRYVAFETAAYGLVPGNYDNSIFVHDMQTGTTEIIEYTNQTFYQFYVGYLFPTLSRDGRYIAFMTDKPGLVPGDTGYGFEDSDVFVYDRQTNTTECVSVSSSGEKGNGRSTLPNISLDGRYVTFCSAATNLVDGDTNGTYDVFLHDRQTGVTERISVGSDGTQGNGLSRVYHGISDGRIIIFASDASNLVPGDTNGASDIFMRDRQTGKTTLLSRNASGGQADAFCDAAAISPDGRYVSFFSLAGNLVSGDTDGLTDVFICPTSDARKVSVTVDNTKPAVGIASPIDRLLMPAGLSTYSIKGTASDARSGVSHVEVSTDDGLNWAPATDTSGAGNWSEWVYVWNLPPSGNCMLKARATDNAGKVHITAPGTRVFIDNLLSLSHTQDGNYVTLTAQLQLGGGPAAYEAIKFNYSADGGLTWRSKKGGSTLADGSLTAVIKLRNGVYMLKAVYAPRTGGMLESDVVDCTLMPVEALSPEVRLITTDPTPVVTWAPYPGATGYVLEICRSKSFKREVTGTADLGLVTEGELPEFLPGQSSNWRVVALIPEGRSVGSAPRRIIYREATSLTQVDAGVNGVFVLPAATLLDSSGQPLVDKPVAFYYNSDADITWRSLGSARSGLDGRAAPTNAKELTGGSYTLRAYYKGDKMHFYSEEFLPFTVGN